jgi:hypothetical protein
MPAAILLDDSLLLDRACDSRAARGDERCRPCVGHPTDTIHRQWYSWRLALASGRHRLMIDCPACAHEKAAGAAPKGAADRAACGSADRARADSSRRCEHDARHPKPSRLHKIGPSGRAPSAVPPRRCFFVEPAGSSADEGRSECSACLDPSPPVQFVGGAAAPVNRLTRACASWR